MDCRRCRYRVRLKPVGIEDGRRNEEDEAPEVTTCSIPHENGALCHCRGGATWSGVDKVAEINRGGAAEKQTELHSLPIKYKVCTQTQILNK